VLTVDTVAVGRTDLALDAHELDHVGLAGHKLVRGPAVVAVGQGVVVTARKLRLMRRAEAIEVAPGSVVPRHSELETAKRGEGGGGDRDWNVLKRKTSLECLLDVAEMTLPVLKLGLRNRVR